MPTVKTDRASFLPPNTASSIRSPVMPSQLTTTANQSNPVCACILTVSAGHSLSPAPWAEYPALPALPPTGSDPDGTLAWRANPASGVPHIPSAVPSIVSRPPYIRGPRWLPHRSFLGRRGRRGRHQYSLGQCYLRCQGEYKRCQTSKKQSHTSISGLRLTKMRFGDSCQKIQGGETVKYQAS